MNKTILSTAIAATLILPSTAVMAEDAPSPLTFNVGVVSDYLFRGISQTGGDAALQGGADYAFSNGAYIGAWGSSISWVKGALSDGSVELDLYGGYKGAFADPDWTYDVGAIAYMYPSHGNPNAFLANPNTTEVYGSIGYRWLSVKYSYSLSDNFVGWYPSSGSGKTNGSTYLELNASFDLGDGLTATAHAGHQKVAKNGPASYSDWKVGVTKDVGFGVIGLAYSATNADGNSVGSLPYSWPDSYSSAAGGSWSGWKDVSKSKLVATFLKSF